MDRETATAFILLVLILTGIHTLSLAQESPQIFPPAITHEDNSSQKNVEFYYGWLSVENFQKLTQNEQDVVVVTTRDTVVLSLHTMNQHSLEECVVNIPQDELEAIRNTALEINPSDERFTLSVVAGIAQLSMILCSVQQPQPQL